MNIQKLVWRSMVLCRNSSARYSTAAVSNTANSSTEVPEVDKLFKRIDVECRSNEPAVLKSYKYFLTETARQLNIPVSKVYEPPKIHKRYTLNKAVFGKKKSMVQYEMRTHFLVVELNRLTGSTADTYLEYVQRNLPEGVAMKVTKYCIESLPDYLKEQKVDEGTS